MHYAFGSAVFANRADIRRETRRGLPRLHRTRTRSGQTTSGNVHSQSIDLEVARGDGNAGTALGTAPIYTPTRGYRTQNYPYGGSPRTIYRDFPWPRPRIDPTKRRRGSKRTPGRLKKCLKRIVETLSCRSRPLGVLSAKEEATSKKQSLMDRRGSSRISLFSSSSFAFSGGRFMEKCPTSFDFRLKRSSKSLDLLYTEYPGVLIIFGS